MSMSSPAAAAVAGAAPFVAAACGGKGPSNKGVIALLAAKPVGVGLSLQEGTFLIWITRPTRHWGDNTPPTDLLLACSTS
jgi:hypothetical protein